MELANYGKFAIIKKKFNFYLEFKKLWLSLHC